MTICNGDIAHCQFGYCYSVTVDWSCRSCNCDCDSAACGVATRGVEAATNQATFGSVIYILYLVTNFNKTFV